jgi:hypothetical protein
MFLSTTRGVMRPVVGGTVALALLVPAAGATQAAPVQQGSTAVAAATTSARTAQVQKVVRKNDFGKAKSRVRGTFGHAGMVTGNFTPRRFKVNKAGDLVGVGRLVAKLTRANGHVFGKVSQRAKIPMLKANGAPLGRVAAAATSCRILNLVLGPLNLNLLGVRVHLNRVHLVIRAFPGPGNLLGNLLCAVAGLLDSGLTPDQLAQLLTAISQILQL